MGRHDQQGSDSMIKCFWLEETNTVQLYLRRYAFGGCEKLGHYHNAMTPAGKVYSLANQPIAVYPVGDYQLKPGEKVVVFGRNVPALRPTPELEAPREYLWPTVCACGYLFKYEDEAQVFSRRIYRRIDTGEQLLLENAPAGAMWDAWWYPDTWKGEDGRSLMVKLPGDREWCVDSQANNCTKPGDTTHRCWIRHGNPPNVTVDKNARGKYSTCAAGAGSIDVPGWHGFLQQGELRKC